ncbi:MAG: hypothetical protein ACI841_003266 [Planctomycetota bacterium]|jgi:hypothetical protein
MQLTGVLLFHLNLCYSSISKERRAEVIQRCYWPMLQLLDRVPGIKLAIEASGHTLEMIEKIDPAWIKELRVEVATGRVEFVGSGDTQLIGPLVPADVNHWNQRLGQTTYERLLHSSPRTALVNEMAWSQGLVDHYLDAGYEAVVMEWNNPRLRHPEWEDEWRYHSVRTASPGGDEIALHWADTTAFQKLQRVAFGEIEIDEYSEWVGSQMQDGRTLFLYSGDAEIFDFRPGRYDTEPPQGEQSEWTRIARSLRRVMDRGVQVKTPSELRQSTSLAESPLVTLTSCADPAPVKKQPKYNLTRWALSGRDDLHLNAYCYSRLEELRDKPSGAREWQHLCRLWGSDLRTHLSLDRWVDLKDHVGSLALPQREVTTFAGRQAVTNVRQLNSSLTAMSNTQASVRKNGRRLELRIGETQVDLNLRRGLAVDRAVFGSLDPEAIFGTLPHGTFDHIQWTADFYSGHTVFEIPGMRRVADLELVEPIYWIEEDAIVVDVEVPTALGPLPKRIRVTESGIEWHYGFSAWGPQPRGSLRTAHITLFPEIAQRPVEITCIQGGVPESFACDIDCNHGQGLSAFISARAAFGASEGPLLLKAGNLTLQFDWCREQCPALPLLSRTTVDGKCLTRLAFSLEEVDDTSAIDGTAPRTPLPDFELSFSAQRVLQPVSQ